MAEQYIYCCSLTQKGVWCQHEGRYIKNGNLYCRNHVFNIKQKCEECNEIATNDWLCQQHRKKYERKVKRRSREEYRNEIKEENQEHKEFKINPKKTNPKCSKNEPIQEYKYHQITCPICIEDITRKDKSILLKCGHIHHEQCLNIWKTYSRTCPMCRAPISLGYRDTPHWTHWTQWFYMEH